MNNLYRKISLLWLLTGCLLAAGTVQAQIRVTRVKDDASLAGRKGVVYVLPRTRVAVDVAIVRKQHFPGPLASMAAEYLGKSDVITKASTIYTIQRASISALSEPDPSRVYFIEKEEKSSGETWVSFQPSNHSILMEKFAKESVPGNFQSWNPDLYQSTDSGKLFGKYSEASTREVVDTLIRKVSIDTLVIEEKIFRRSMVGVTDKEKASEALDRIRQIEQDKYNLLVGYQETAYSREALEFMYSTLENERLEYLSLFTGVEVTEQLKFRFEILPDPSLESQKYVIGGFAENSGIMQAGNDNELIINIKADIFPSVFNEDEVVFTGLVYRIPAMVTATLSWQEKELANGRFEVAQLGSLFSLPPDFRRIEFDLSTGTVRQMVLE
jgi:hypothetical protein